MIVIMLHMKQSVSVMKSIYLIKLYREVIPLGYEKNSSPFMHCVCIKDSRRKVGLKLCKVTNGWYTVQLHTNRHESIERGNKTETCNSLQVFEYSDPE
jgi:hypothetical protein